MPRRPAILDCASLLSDVTRCRVLGLLERQELTVTEMCAVLQLPQSTVSRHLKLLGDGGWLRTRRDGTSHFYQLAARELDAPARRMWTLVRGQLQDATFTHQDQQRLEGILAERRSRSQAFFTSAADRWDHLRDELFGRRFDLMALPALLDPSFTVGDLACGTGRMAESLAPFVERVVAVDGSAAMLSAARRRLAAIANVELCPGQLEALPLESGSLDAATIILALHYVADPGRALAETRRVLKPGGRLLLVDMMPHDREEYREQMGHVWMGFAAERIEADLATAGFAAVTVRPLPGDPSAKGPALFVAGATHPRVVPMAVTTARSRASDEIRSKGERA